MKRAEQQHSLPATADLLGVSTRTVRRYMSQWIKSSGRDGLGPPLYQRGRVFFRESTIRDFQESNQLSLRP